MNAIGALLAGGRSRRMGTDKALLAVGGGTLLDHMLAKLRALPLDEVVICRDAPGCLADALPGLGPLGALYSLSLAYPGRELLAVPVDMPLLRAATLSALLGGGDRAPRHYHAHFLPLRLVLDPVAIAAIAARTATDARDRSLAGLLRALGARALPLPGDAEEFANLNQPGDWARLRDHL
ncbi:MAG: molybdenum cofactor guanylyltransferase [Pseudomonadota bacterium]